jgi:hypothetical protein
LPLTGETVVFCSPFWFSFLTTSPYLMRNFKTFLPSAARMVFVAEERSVLELSNAAGCVSVSLKSVVDSVVETEPTAGSFLMNLISSRLTGSLVGVLDASGVAEVTASSSALFFFFFFDGASAESSFCVRNQTPAPPPPSTSAPTTRPMTSPLPPRFAEV